MAEKRFDVPNVKVYGRNLAVEGDGLDEPDRAGKELVRVKVINTCIAKACNVSLLMC